MSYLLVLAIRISFLRTDCDCIFFCFKVLLPNHPASQFQFGLEAEVVVSFISAFVVFVL
uniref:Uncharacterized protein n=1 Tax=Arundo donax TaxID=35708 RepID=A0A0A8YSK9_ARUDO